MEQKKRVFWQVPNCAWHRTIGDIPEKAKLAYDKQGNMDTPNRTKKGMPLGGIGTGSFMLNFCGSFGPWNMKAGRYEERFLSQAAFHVWEQVEGKPSIQRTLATDDVLPAWQRLNKGAGDYYALFPRGWFTYNCFNTDISLLSFSPVIKDNYKETSYPVALFLFRVHNPGPAKTTVSVMFTFPNAQYTGPTNQNYEEATRRVATMPLLQVMEPIYIQRVEEMARDRKGLTNHAITDGLTAVVMRADDPTNPYETQETEWCIAAPSPATYVTNWDGAGDGSDIWKDFSDGRLSNQSLANDSQEPAGAIASQVTLQPGEEKILPFVLVWDFPQVEFGSGTRWWKRYTEYFPSRKMNSLAIVSEALKNYQKWLQKVNGWTKPIEESPAIPDWLKQGGLNELYYTIFCGSFWENGCITKPKKFGARKGQHLHFVVECPEYPFAETFDVRHFASRSYRDLWPKIERDILLAWADFIMDTKYGACPHDAGSPYQDPYFEYDYAWRGIGPELLKLVTQARMHKEEYGEGPDWLERRKQQSKRDMLGYIEPDFTLTMPWSDLNPKFIAQVHAYWHKTRDDAFLKDVWPAIIRNFNHQLSQDKDGDGISELGGSEYFENKIMAAIHWIGALEAIVDMAEAIDDKKMLDKANVEIQKARQTTETKMWNEKGYYQYSPNIPELLTDAFLGQRYVDVTGLPPVLDQKRMASHYRMLFRLGVLPLPDYDGDGIGNAGIINLVGEDGTFGGNNHELGHKLEVWIGVAYCMAANMYHLGRDIQDGAMQAHALLAAWGLYHNVWQNESTAYWFHAPECWRYDDVTKCRGIMYQRARAIWELMMETHDPFVSKS